MLICFVGFLVELNNKTSRIPLSNNSIIKGVEGANNIQCMEISFMKSTFFAIFPTTIQPFKVL